MNQDIVKGGTDLFYRYLIKHKDQVRQESLDGYYHVDVVAEAYNQGFKDGADSGKKDYMEDMHKTAMERFVQRATQVYLLTKNLVTFLNQRKYPVESIHLDILANCPRVIISVKNDYLNNDIFVELSYGKIFEMKRIFTDLFNLNLDMGLISSDNLNYKLLVEDGFGYSENLIAK
jgi:hypothetical protein